MAYDRGGGSGPPGAGVAPSMPFDEQIKGGKWRPGEPHWWATGRPGNVRQRPNNY
ncbi:MAG: hypothetical protein M3164_01760 [Actinomycetota bacterium]|nr:hypothetical protein [Actinomycetota bacterium]